MKIRDLVKEIELCKKRWKSFLDWDIYTEQCTERDKKHKRTKQEWEIVKDSEDWEYFKCAGDGFFTKMPKKRIFTININW